MKSYIVAFCIVILLASGGFSQSPAEKDLLEKLFEGPDKAKALETVLKAPDQVSALILYLGADVALKEKRLEDSAFLFYAGQLRKRFDKECFPPKGTGWDSPFVAFAALSRQIGGEDVQVNAWNWRPTLEFLRPRNIITSEHAELLGCNGCGARVDAGLANQMAAAVENKLSTMAPGDRIRADLTVTSVPKAPQVFGPDTQPSDIDITELYSATYEWLVTFKDFCKRCDGFMVP